VHSGAGATAAHAPKHPSPTHTAELAALALCLETTVEALALPRPEVSLVAFGNQVVPAQRLSFIDDSVQWDGDDLKITAPSLRYRALELRLAREPDPQVKAEIEALADQVRRGDIPPGESEAADIPVRQPVAAAIVTSARGVLLGRRNDGKPPWTFIAGEVEPFDNGPEPAAVREVKEETGIDVLAGRIIGERVHPRTGRTMIYIAASPTHSTRVFVGDEAELAEVRWVSLAEADELMPDIFGPVREYLARTIGKPEQE
jgi:8-oxo-dGTP pyrophosphatase MutT (NUDIX family)